MKYSIRIFTAILICTGMALAGCNIDRGNNADSIQAKKTTEMATAAAQSVGMPNVVNFTEKRFAKLLYELKDSGVTTYSYFMDMKGGLHFLCESIGYGMNASVQYSNPERVVRNNGQSFGSLPQPEPNGLFMPEGLAATFVLCSDGKGGVKPVYSEPELIVSPFRLNSVGSYSN